MDEATSTRLTIGTDALLENAPFSVTKQLKSDLTLDNPRYRDAKKYARWIGKNLPPKLYFYSEDANAFRFPRGLTNHALQLCRDASGGKLPVICDNRRIAPEINLAFEGRLRLYQQDALNNLLKYDFGILEAGTGSGKTIIALGAVAARKQPVIILVHTKELLYQWCERIKTFLRTEPGLIGDGRFEIAPVTVAIVNTAKNHLSELPEHFGHIVVDECHRVPATLFTDVVTAFDCKYSLGLSATAFRRDGLTSLIYYYLGNRSFKVDPERLQKTGAVLRPEFIQKQTEFRFVFRGDYQKLLKSLTGNSARNKLIADDIAAESKKSSGSILVVSDRIAHCEKILELLEKYDIRAVLLTGRTPPEKRTELVDKLRSGKVKVLISTLQLIGEGFDYPGLQTLFLTTPIKFSGRLLQVVGRILRPSKGKKPRVYDYVDQVGLLRKSAAARRHVYQENFNS